MIRYKRISGVSIPGFSGQNVVITPEGKAMGSVPGWSVFGDPAYLVNGNPRNRARPNSIMNAADGPYPLSEFGPGEPAAEHLVTLSTQANVTINRSEFSFFCVLKPNLDTAAPSARPFIRADDDTDDGLFYPRFGIFGGEIGSKDLRVTDGAAANLVAAPGAVTEDVGLYMFTFSEARGWSIYKNAVLLAHAPDETQVFERGYQAGTWRLWNGYRGLTGMHGLLDIDLSDPVNSGHRRAIEKFLMQKYGIIGAS